MKKSKIPLISLFSGAGALDLAFHSTGAFQTIIAVEKEDIFIDTYKKNVSNGILRCNKIIHADVREISLADHFEIKMLKSMPLGIIGGPPCETFSTMGKKQGFNDNRGLLVFSFAEHVISLDAHFFVMENVPQLLTADKGKPFSDLIKLYENNKYNVKYKVLDASHYGSPTLRKRLILVGNKLEFDFSFPEPTHGPNIESNINTLKPFTTVKDAINDIIKTNDSINEFPTWHVATKHTENVSNRFKNLKQGDYDYIRKRSKLSWSEPSKSLVAGNLAGIRSHIHPEEPRELTNRESARIQGFPDKFEFCGNHAAVGKQIANAVPLALGRAIAEQLIHCLQGI